MATTKPTNSMDRRIESRSRKPLYLAGGVAAIVLLFAWALLAYPDAPADLRALATALAELREADQLLAYHDRSDGGLLVTLLEMAFAGGTGLAHDRQPLGVPVVRRPRPTRSRWQRHCS